VHPEEGDVMDTPATTNIGERHSESGKDPVKEGHAADSAEECHGRPKADRDMREKEKTNSQIPLPRSKTGGTGVNLLFKNKKQEVTVPIRKGTFRRTQHCLQCGAPVKDSRPPIQEREKNRKNRQEERRGDAVADWRFKAVN